jgi:hypothetical protein
MDDEELAALTVHVEEIQPAQAALREKRVKA